MSVPEASLQPAVFDAGPLIYLYSLDYANLLPSLHSILVPPAVSRELAVRPGEPGGRLPECARIEHKTPGREYASSVVREPPALDEGETEAIALALQSESLVVLDDLRARGRARRLRLELTGTLGILLRLHRLGLATRDLTSDLEMLEKAGMYLPGDLRDAVLEAGRVETEE